MKEHVLFIFLLLLQLCAVAVSFNQKYHWNGSHLFAQNIEHH